MSNASKLDKEVWNEYMEHWDEQYMEGEMLLAQKKQSTIEKLYNIDLNDYQETDGRETTRTVKVRLNQSILEVWYSLIIITSAALQACNCPSYW